MHYMLMQCKLGMQCRGEIPIYYMGCSTEANHCVDKKNVCYIRHRRGERRD